MPLENSTTQASANRNEETKLGGECKISKLMSKSQADFTKASAQIFSSRKTG